MESLPPFALTQEVLGIAFSSPLFTSPGLMGKQGWSPCSSDCHSDGGESLSIGSPAMYSSAYHNNLTLLNSFAPTVASRHLSWPLPPSRQSWGKTQNFSRPRAMSSCGQLAATDLQSTKHDNETQKSPSSPQESSSSQSVSTPGSEHSEVHAFKRFFSAPNRETVSMLGDVLDQSGLPPIMPDAASFKNSEWDDEEAVKLNRLQASFSLLGLRQSTVEQAVLFEDEDDSRKPMQSSVSIPDLGFTGAGLGLSDLTIQSPELERSASSLEVQMAIAGGFGEQCTWMAAERGIRASSDNYLPMTATICNLDEDDSLEDESENQVTQEDRRLASRHVRQNVAARKQSMDHIGRDVAKIPEPVRILNAPFDMDEPLGWSLDSALQRNLSTRSTASTVFSNESPIIGGMLSANSFESLAQKTPVPVPNEITRKRESLAFDVEFSYLASDASLFEVQECKDEDAADETINADQSASGTLTASQSATDISFTGSATSMSALPSPTAEASSCFPERRETEANDSIDAILTAASSASSGMTKSASSMSILDRPRPRARAGAPSIFARSESMDIARVPTQTRRRMPTSASTSQVGTLGSLQAKSPSSKLTPSQTLPVIPPRSVSLEVHPDVDEEDDSDNASEKSSPVATPPIVVPSFWNPNAPMPASILKTSKSVGCLSPIGQMQLQEVCELKRALQSDAKPASTMPWLHSKAAAMSVDQLNLQERRQPQAWQQKRSASIKTSLRRVSSKRFLPTLFTARTPSQRVNGQTGIPATEPRNLALARLGMKLGFGTRSSHVEAMPQKHVSRFPQSKSTTSLPLAGNHSFISLADVPEMPALSATQTGGAAQKKRRHALRQTSEEDVCSVDSALPEGFVLVTEVSTVTVERTLA